MLLLETIPHAFADCDKRLKEKKKNGACTFIAEEAFTIIIETSLHYTRGIMPQRATKGGVISAA